MHNGPAFPAAECDCGAILAAGLRKLAAERMRDAHELLAGLNALAQEGRAARARYEATCAPPPPGAKYIPFVLNVGELEAGIPMDAALTLHEDGSITVDWQRLEIYARVTPVDLANCRDIDFRLGCMVRALLAMRDGRVEVVGVEAAQ